MRWRLLKLDWAYAIGEFIIVIAGVLIALTIDQWNDGRLQTNFALFYSVFKDQQINRVFQDENGLPFFTTVNAGESHIQGLEAEINAILNENWRLEFTGAYLDAEFDDYFAVAANGTEVDMKGVRMGSAPEYSLQAALNYTTTIGSGGSLHVRGEVQTRDDVDSILPNSDGSQLVNIPRPGYTTLNAFVTYTSQSGRWGVTLYGRNLTDEFYLLTQNRWQLSSGEVIPRFGFPAAPRTYGIRLSLNY